MTLIGFKTMSLKSEIKTSKKQDVYGCKNNAIKSKIKTTIKFNFAHKFSLRDKNNNIDYSFKSPLFNMINI